GSIAADRSKMTHCSHKPSRNSAAQHSPAISGFASLESAILPSASSSPERSPMFKLALSAIAASLLALTLDITAAQAQPARVFVSATGNDANSCSFAAPCRTFQHAHAVVAAKGEIDVLDPAGYGPLTVSKSISIQGHGFAGISVASGNAITITA